MSRTHLRGFVLGVIALVSVACGGGAPSAVTPGTDGNERASDPNDPVTDGAPPSEGSASGDGSGPSVTGGGSRAILSATPLTRCEAGEVIHGAHTPAALVIDPPIGTCWMTEGFGAPGSPHAEPELRALADAAALRAVLSCRPDAELEADASASYFTLRHVHYASDTWEVVFAEDDGARVHVGLRLRRACQGTPPQTIQATTLMSLPGRERTLTVHFCERDPRPCPPVP